MSDLNAVRLDVWLDIACLFKTRSEAQKAVRGGKVAVNGQRSKPHREVQPGDEVLITRAFGYEQRVVIRAVADRHVPKAQARDLYEDRTPPLPPEEIERRRLARIARAIERPRSAGAPNKRERRLLRKLKGR
jgi:ribosome-associated heat shock protein Hsp15